MSVTADAAAGWAARALIVVALLAGFARAGAPHYVAPAPEPPAGLELAGAPQSITSLLSVPGRMQYGQSVWSEGKAAGPVWVRIDRRAQLISVFRGGDEIGTAVILYGAPSKPTPAGRYPVLAKMRDHRSATYNNADMPFTLRLTGDGVSIHAANVQEGRATHGCIGVPEDFARRLFDAVKVGDPVVIV